MNKQRVCAVVTTYNRKYYLINLMHGLFNQTKHLEAILLYDNNSNDGTSEMLIERGWIESDDYCTLMCKNVNGINVMYYRSNLNEGSSGGAHGGMKIASSMNFDYLWYMDDDVLPEKNCLEELIKNMSPSVMLCQPSRTDENNRDCAIIGLNMENPFLFSLKSRSVTIFNEEIKGDTVEIKAMPFEGPLIDIQLIKEIGLPKKDLFILFDDTDFAIRAQKKTKLLYCKKAILHRQIISTSVPHLKGWKEYYGMRNQIWFDRTYGENFSVRHFRPIIFVLALYVRAIQKRRWKDIRVIKQAYVDGVHGNLGITVKPGTTGENFSEGIICR